MAASGLGWAIGIRGWGADPGIRVRCGAALVAALLALAGAPAAAQEGDDPVPDQLDPPASGEAEYPRDPSEPEQA